MSYCDDYSEGFELEKKVLIPQLSKWQKCCHKRKQAQHLLEEGIKRQW
jgi:hypothetical protein